MTLKTPPRRPAKALGKGYQVQLQNNSTTAKYSEDEDARIPGPCLGWSSADKAAPVVSVLAAARSQVHAFHGLSQERALRRLRRLALALEDDAWAGWARTELKRAHRERKCRP